MTHITETESPGHRTATGIRSAAVLAGCVLTAASIAFAIADSGRQDRLLAAAVQLLCVALPVGLGLLRLRRQRDDRFAQLLIGAGLLWSVVTFAQSTNAALYSVGRSYAWLFEVVIV